MDAAETMAERHARQLTRLGEMSLVLAEDVQVAALASSTVDDKSRLAVAFQRAARVVRQAIGLEAKLVRDQARDAREAVQASAAVAAQATETRKRQVRAGVERRIFTELDPREGEAWLADLDERLEEEALYDDFDDEPVDAQIERLSAELGLTGEAVRDYLPRAFRRPGGLPSRDYAAILDAFSPDNDEEEPDDEEEEDQDEGDEEDEGEEDEGEEDESEEDGSEDRDFDAAPAATAEPQAAEPDPPRLPPPEPEPPPPPPQPPEPPEPEPYIPPWERLRPGQRFPGGSGY